MKGRITDGQTDGYAFVFWEGCLAESVLVITLLEDVLVLDSF